MGSGVVAPDLEDYVLRVETLRDEIQQAERNLDKLNKRHPSQHAATVSLESVLPYAAKLRETLCVGSFKERKTFLAGLIERIDIFKESVNVEYRLPIANHRAGDRCSVDGSTVWPAADTTFAGPATASSGTYRSGVVASR